ncbi:MAG: hypothetical protein JWQ22_43 [Devosia sp.]|nr:hypothetical protein [Devosia sp.]
MQRKSTRIRNDSRVLVDDARAQYRWHGVNFESTAADAAELDTMLDVVSALSPVDRAVIGKMVCDSDVGHCSVHLKRDYRIAAKIVTTCAAVVYARFGAVRSISVVPSDFVNN